MYAANALFDSFTFQLRKPQLGTPIPLLVNMASSEQYVGFIGLGVMGYPMAQNLLKKLPPSSNILVYDIVADALHRIKSEGGDRIFVCRNAQEVADQSVWIILSSNSDSPLRLTVIGNPPHYAP